MKLPVSLLFVPVLSLGGTLPAAAELYLGAGMGYAKLDSVDADRFCDQIDQEIGQYGLQGNCSQNDSDTAYKIFAGWRFNPYVALEGGWIDQGDFGVKSWQSDGTNLLEQRGTGSSDAFFGAVVLSWPFHERASLFGKLGFNSWDSDGKATTIANGKVVQVEAGGDSGTDPVYGIGLDFSLHENWGVRPEWEHFEADEDDVDVFGLSLLYLLQ